MENTKNLKKQLLAAIIMLLVAALALGTSTYAWFVSNNEVTAKDMKVKAQAEEGLVISNADHAVWKTVASATETAVKEVMPASTANFTDWFHNKSDSASDAKKNQATESYETITTSDLDNYRAAYKFWVRAAGNEDVAKALQIKEVSVDPSQAQDLNKALRVGIKIEGDDTAYIFNPFSGENTYKVKNITDVTTVTAPQATSLSTVPAQTSCDPGNGDFGIEVNVFVWYEGEDKDCRSELITNDISENAITIKLAI